MEKKFKINLQDGGRGGHFGFLIKMVLAIFDLQVTPIVFIESTGLSVQEKKAKINFQNGGHGGYLRFTIVTI